MIEIHNNITKKYDSVIQDNLLIQRILMTQFSGCIPLVDQLLIGFMIGHMKYSKGLMENGRENVT